MVNYSNSKIFIIRSNLLFFISYTTQNNLSRVLYQYKIKYSSLFNHPLHPLLLDKISHIHIIEHFPCFSEFGVLVHWVL
jgi:hypothetical protein